MKPLTEGELCLLFPGLEFEEERHIYKVDGKVYPSVSTLLKSLYKEFDMENVAYGYARKHGFEASMVKEAWRGESKKATDWGTKVHNFAEMYARMFYGIGHEWDKASEWPEVTCKQGLGAVQFFHDLPDYMEPVACELQMYSKKYGYCGTCDLILYNHKENYYTIGDYKTNERLTSEYNTDPLLLLPKSLGLLQDSFGKYTAQFSLYQILLEEVGIRVGSRVLIHLREQESKKLYGMHKTLDITKDLRKLLEKNLLVK